MRSLLAVVALSCASLVAGVLDWPTDRGVQLHAKGIERCLITERLTCHTEVKLGLCTDSFPGWHIPAEGNATMILLATTQFSVDAGRSDGSSLPEVGALVNLKPPWSTGPVPGAGNSQNWWGHRRGDDIWFEYAGQPRIRNQHSNLCLERDSDDIKIARCRPSHNNVTSQKQLWTISSLG